MTQLLERAYADVEQLMEPDQDAIAALILTARFQEAFAGLPTAVQEQARRAYR